MASRAIVVRTSHGHDLGDNECLTRQDTAYPLLILTDPIVLRLDPRFGQIHARRGIQRAYRDEDRVSRCAVLLSGVSALG
jgi:hypothetical protein